MKIEMKQVDFTVEIDRFSEAAADSAHFAFLATKCGKART
jgi:hypothetical protein